jgi:RecA-family ATPase
MALTPQLMLEQQARGLSESRMDFRFVIGPLLRANDTFFHLPEVEVQEIAARVYKNVMDRAPLAWAEDGSSPWDKYHTLADLENVPEGRFTVEGILYENSITALAGYAGDRKSIVSLNLAAACVTGQPFMDRFTVVNAPKRVIYLCPEMGLRELARLSTGLGMMPYVGKTLFFRSLDKTGKIRLRDLTPEELNGSLVILDTAVRFIEGKENDPQDMAVFSDELFRLRNECATVWVLFHSSKASVGQELSLQNAVRGSSEIAACLSMCWATRLNEPSKRYESTSRMYPLKVREFEALPFDFKCERETAACKIIGDPAPIITLRERKTEEKRRIIEELLKHDRNMGVNKIQTVLKERTGSGGMAAWVSEEKKRILGGTSGSVLTE